MMTHSVSRLAPLRAPRHALRVGCVLAWLFLPLLVGVSMLVQAAAQVDVYYFPEPELEDRYRGLIDEFRCPKCLNTNLAGSDAPIAQDLRRTVHRLLVVDGFSDDEVREFLQERYGDFVLYNPPFKPGTWILWLAPIGFVTLGAIIVLRVLRRQAALAEGGQVVLSDVQAARLQAIVDDPAQAGVAAEAGSGGQELGHGG